MLVAFETKSYSKVVFFDDIARDLLHAMGKSGDVPGAMLADDVPDAIARLQRRLRQSDVADAPSETEEDEEPRVDLATRAFPLLELLSAAAENGDDVIWKKA